ncbi:MAG: hypothetical protein QOH72_1844 [Solirubrobacteraceae bacterium]|nr:hypothetical protein [Solirubrobacteraceae bacterium]
MHLIARPLRRRLSGEAGFTLITVMAVMAIVMLFSVGAMAAVNGDFPGSGQDVTRKQAMAAAEAGVADYLFHLNSDSAYWTKCTTAGPGLNDPWTTSTPPATTSWRTVPGTTDRYAIELLPAKGSGYTKCDPTPANVSASMIDAGTRELRFRVTGRAVGNKGTVERSVIAAVKRKSFLDYLYFTNYETSDTKWWALVAGNRPSVPDNAADGTIQAWAEKTCARYYRPAPAGGSSAQYNRPGQVWWGNVDWYGDGGQDHIGIPCSYMDILFATDDKLQGPVHTNDEMYTCGAFTLGASSTDRIESGRSWRLAPSSSCKGTTATSPNMVGTFVPGAGTVEMPPTDSDLATVATSTYTFTGNTKILLRADGNVDVTNGGTTTTMAYPTNGVIYVKNATCPIGYQPLNPYNQVPPITATNPYASVPAGCGQAWVHGTYNKDLTIAAEDDVVIDGDVLEATGADARLGLIANNFVRVAHPVDRNATDPAKCTEPSTGKITGREIDAAMLSLQHSIMVDNYYCGGNLGTLKITGVLAQNFRGAVGTNAGATGFTKDYNYDRRLNFRGPPHFLDPVRSAWKLRGFTEQQQR